MESDENMSAYPFRVQPGEEIARGWSESRVYRHEPGWVLKITYRKSRNSKELERANVGRGGLPLRPLGLWPSQTSQENFGQSIGRDRQAIHLWWLWTHGSNFSARNRSLKRYTLH